MTIEFSDEFVDDLVNTIIIYIKVVVPQMKAISIPGPTIYNAVCRDFSNLSEIPLRVCVFRRESTDLCIGTHEDYYLPMITDKHYHWSNEELDSQYSYMFTKYETFIERVHEVYQSSLVDLPINHHQSQKIKETLNTVIAILEM